MVRPRINQFADDMGITRSQAVKLINEGRRRRDGGSQTVEKNMGKMKLPKHVPRAQSITCALKKNAPRTIAARLKKRWKKRQKTALWAVCVVVVVPRFKV